MKKLFRIKDSGKRVKHKSGLVREALDEKVDYTLCDMDMLTRWAELLTRGAKKYGRRDWQMANSKEELERFKSSAFRHFIQWINEVDDGEDHGAAVFFNISAVEMIKKKLNKKKL